MTLTLTLAELSVFTASCDRYMSAPYDYSPEEASRLALENALSLGLPRPSAKAAARAAFRAQAKIRVVAR